MSTDIAIVPIFMIFADFLRHKPSVNIDTNSKILNLN